MSVQIKEIDMNRQVRKLLGVTQDDANEIISSVFEINSHWELEYYAFPMQFGNTVGPLKRSNMSMSGQAFTTFTIEAWSDGRNTVLFCQGLVIDVRSDVDGFDPIKVRL